MRAWRMPGAQSTTSADPRTATPRCRSSASCAQRMLLVRARAGSWRRRGRSLAHRRAQRTLAPCSGNPGSGATPAEWPCACVNSGRRRISLVANRASHSCDEAVDLISGVMFSRWSAIRRRYLPQRAMAVGQRRVLLRALRGSASATTAESVEPATTVPRKRSSNRARAEDHRAATGLDSTFSPPATAWLRCSA